ncbi:hypothetical protein Tco_0815854 [Tanacetum coccineum]
MSTSRLLYGDEAMILKESLMMLLVSNVMEFGVDVTDNNRICYTVHRKEAATDSLNIDCDQDKKQQMKKIRVLLTLLLGSKYLFKYCCAGWIKISGTDKTKITRKPSKTDKHGHGNQKSIKEAKDSKPKPRKVNYGQASVKSGQTVKESQTLVKRSQPLEDKNPNVSI